MSGLIGGVGSKSGVIGTTELEYEEGAWTPTSSGLTLTPSSGCNYTRIGNRVTVSSYITVSGSTSGDLVIGGLPFTNTGASQAAGSVYLRDVNGTISNGYVSVVIATGTSFYIRRGGMTGSGSDINDFMDADSNFWFSLTYETGA